MPDRGAPEVGQIQIVGASANNLKDVDYTFPSPGVSAVVGVSGSGKTSLLRDTLAAEAIRRNMIFLGKADHTGLSEAPLVDAFVGTLPPALFVGQRPFRASDRTTIATASGILTDLRALFIADGASWTQAGKKVSEPSPDCYADWLSVHYRGRAVVWTIPLRWQADDGSASAKRLIGAGIETAVLRSETDKAVQLERGRKVDLRRWKPLNPNVRHALEAELGTVKVGSRSTYDRLRTLLHEAWKISGPDVMVELLDSSPDLAPHSQGAMLDGRRDWVDANERQLFRRPGRHLLSFNAPEHEDSGACPVCRGIGHIITIDDTKLIPDPSLSLREGAIALWAPKAYTHLNIQHEMVEGLARQYGFSSSTPWKNLKSKVKVLLMDGTGEELIQGLDPSTGKRHGGPRKFEGFRKAILRRIDGKAAEKLSAFIRAGSCEACSGSRFSSQALALRAAGKGLGEWLGMPFSDMVHFAGRAADEGHMSAQGRAALKRIAAKADIYCRLGLGHLRCTRGMTTVSDGEGRRLQIGRALAGEMADLLLLLDEPARGLHEADLAEMAGVLRTLGKNNAVIVNEHRDSIIGAADRVVELGPGAGPEGGTLLAGDWKPSKPKLRKVGRVHLDGGISIKGGCIHNVTNQDVTVPLGGLVSIVGVSGSGKSSFVNGVLVPALVASGVDCRGEIDWGGDRGTWKMATGMKSLRQVHLLRQRVPPRNKRSLVATVTGAFDQLAAAWAATSEARKLRLGPVDFRLNGGAGRCPECLGLGEVEQAGTFAACPACGGLRYGSDALVPRLFGLTIATALTLPVSVFLDRLRDLEPGPFLGLASLFEAMVALGIGHVPLGRRLDTLSGGEVQRLRVAELLTSSEDATHNLFVLDEPGAGLHPRDGEGVLASLRAMIDGSHNSVLIIEHNLDLIAASDWVIEFGPGAGDQGGRVIASGPPGEVAERNTPTGLALRGKLAGRGLTAPMSSRVTKDTLGAPVDRLLAEIESGEDESARETGRPNFPERLLEPSRRIWEIGDLHLELAKLAVSAHEQQVEHDRVELLRAWREEPDARLMLAPALQEMRVWGRNLPRSVRENLAERIRGLPLEPQSGGGQSNFPATYAIAGRFESASEARSALDRALAIGGGVACLRSRKGDFTVTQSPVLFEKGLVGPTRLDPKHLSRLAPAGCCPACKSTGRRRGTDLTLIYSGRTPFWHFEALHPQAQTLLKGRWRTDGAPFFKRLKQEELEETLTEQMFLFGYWARPGHGSFLKNATKDPREVASWLRWDGLYSMVWEELPRAKDRRWAEQVANAGRWQACHVCDGTGHQEVGRAVMLLGRSLFDWVASGTVGELRAALLGHPFGVPRDGLSAARVRSCLEALDEGLSLAMPVKDTETTISTFAERLFYAFVAGRRG